MIPFSLEAVATAVGGRLCDVPDSSVLMTAPAVVDSRTVEPGGLFAALPGEQADGHAFAVNAVKAGAVAVLATRPVGVPAVVVDDVLDALAALARAVLGAVPEATVIGLTGSAGKTSTKDLIAQVLPELGETIATAKSFNGEIGMPLTVTHLSRGVRYIVLEMGARGIGHITHLTRIAPPTVGLVLNVGTAHVGEFGGREQIAKAKGELVEALPADGLAVLNADDPLVAAMASRTRARVLTFGIENEADVRAVDVALDTSGRASFTLTATGAKARVDLSLYGEHHVANALAAAAVAIGLGAACGEDGGGALPRGPGGVGAHGGHRQARRSASHQRRVQREPRLDEGGIQHPEVHGGRAPDHRGPGRDEGTRRRRKRRTPPRRPSRRRGRHPRTHRGRRRRRADDGRRRPAGEPAVGGGGRPRPRPRPDPG